MTDDPKCPICGAVAKRLDKVGDADGFDCPKHAKFKVSGTAMTTMGSRTQSEWEAALHRAKKRCAPGGWPMIMEQNF